MNNATDNFDALWSNLREAVKTARTKREAIYTDGGGVFLSEHSGRVSIDKGDEDGATIRTGVAHASLSFNCQPEDLRAIAAQCLAAAEEVEEAIAEAQAVRPTLSAQRA